MGYGVEAGGGRVQGRGGGGSELWYLNVQKKVKFPVFSAGQVDRLTGLVLSQVDRYGMHHRPTEDSGLTFWIRFSGTFDNTLVIFHGDHGPRFAPFRATETGRFTASLPMQIMIFPRWFKEQYPHLVAQVRVYCHIIRS